MCFYKELTTIKHVNKNGLYAFYGTLRCGMENYALFDKGMRYIRTVVLRGYRLVSLGEYPYAVRTNDSSTIVAELFRLDEHAAGDINVMELESGYYYDEIEINQSLYGIYLFDRINPGDEVIPSGDWVKYITERSF